MTNQIYFSKVKPDAIIPSKRLEDAAYDIYACFDEDYILIEPFTSKLIPTGIASAFSEDYVAIFRERGSTGVKNIKINAGVIDSGYRSEWFVSIYNANEIPLFISKDNVTLPLISVFGKTPIVYPYIKAIAQCLIVPVPKLEVKEIPYEQLTEIKSERGMGSLGSSNK